MDQLGLIVQVTVLGIWWPPVLHKLETPIQHIAESTEINVIGCRALANQSIKNRGPGLTASHTEMQMVLPWLLPLAHSQNSYLTVSSWYCFASLILFWHYVGVISSGEERATLPEVSADNLIFFLRWKLNILIHSFNVYLSFFWCRVSIMFSQSTFGMLTTFQSISGLFFFSLFFIQMPSHIIMKIYSS